jgi:eukaryotic-like serine/threonine-protein kinase
MYVGSLYSSVSDTSLRIVPVAHILEGSEAGFVFGIGALLNPMLSARQCLRCGTLHDASVSACPSPQRPASVAPGPVAREPLSPGAMRRPPERGIESAAAQANRPWDDLVGSTIAERYEIRGILGQGGMGTVFRGYHLDLDRPVAVKVLNPAQIVKRSAVQRFHNEARSSGMIGHPNICEVYDLGTLPSGSPYLVMEFIRGETLSARIARDKAMGLLAAIDVISSVLAGLVAAHSKSIVHRDIKPENIMLLPPPSNGVKILDFGVSKMLGPDPYGEGEDVLSLTRTGMVMGTPYYMSAEQARGERDLDVRVDVYACGVMLYEALTGKRPYTASNYNALLLKIVGGPPTPLLKLKPELPPAIGEIVARAMKLERKERYQNAYDFRTELQSLREQIGSRARASRDRSSRRGASVKLQSSPPNADSFGSARPPRAAGAFAPAPLEALTSPESPVASRPVPAPEFDEADTVVFRPTPEEAAKLVSRRPRPAAGAPALRPQRETPERPSAERSGPKAGAGASGGARPPSEVPPRGSGRPSLLTPPPASRADSPDEGQARPERGAAQRALRTSNVHDISDEALDDPSDDPAEDPADATEKMERSMLPTPSQRKPRH